jgi:hypothetical protein
LDDDTQTTTFDLHGFTNDMSSFEVFNIHASYLIGESSVWFTYIIWHNE